MGENQGWHIAIEGDQQGPFSLDILAGMVSEGKLTPESLVWREGMANWTAARDVAEVAGILQTAAAPVSPRPATPPPAAPPPQPAAEAQPAAVAPQPTPVAAQPQPTVTPMPAGTPPMGQAMPMGQAVPPAQPAAPAAPAEVPPWLRTTLWGGADEHVAGLRDQSRFLLVDIFALAGAFVVILGTILPWYSIPFGFGSGLMGFPGMMTFILGLGIGAVHVVSMFMPLQIWTRITVRGAALLGAIMVLVGLISASSFLSSPGFGIFITMLGGLVVCFAEVVLSVSRTPFGLAMTKPLGGGAPAAYQAPAATPTPGWAAPQPQAPAPQPAQAPQGREAAPSGDIGGKLEKLNQLKARGVITEEEYNAKKKEILDRL